MSFPVKLWWTRMPGTLRSLFAVSVLDCLAAIAAISMLLAGYDELRHLPWATAIGVLFLSAALTYGIWMEYRYPRLLATIALTAQPFAIGEVSAVAVVFSAVVLLIALLGLYWNDDVAGYYLSLGSRDDSLTPTGTKGES